MEPRTRAELLGQLRDQAAAIDLAGLVERHETPVVVIDPFAAATRLDELAAALPSVAMHYAVTALPHPAIVQALWGRAGFALSNVRELDVLEQAGVPADGAILTQVVKTPTDISRAYLAGVRTFVVDNPAEIDKFAGFPKDLRVLVRIAPAGTASTVGTSPDRVVNLVRYALSAGINVSGLAFHLGASARSVVALEAALRTSLALMDQTERDLGVRLDTLDIGGGFPAAAIHREAEIAAIAATVRTATARRADLSIIAEPGRYIAAASALHVGHVIGQATRDGEAWIYLDDGVFGAFSRVMTDGSEPAAFSLAETLGSTERLYPVTIAGPTGAARDVIASRHLLPPVGVGDVVISRYAVAYGAATALGTSGQASAVVVADRLPEHDLVPALVAV